jgi:hypothetical protein
MGVEKRNGWFFFRCEVDDARRDEPAGVNWDENRLAFARAKEQGWWLSKQRGKWVALCPGCASTHKRAFPTKAGGKFTLKNTRTGRTF